MRLKMYEQAPALQNCIADLTAERDAAVAAFDEARGHVEALLDSHPMTRTQNIIKARIWFDKGGPHKERR